MSADAHAQRAGTGAVAVAYSGGRDSTALLHATLRAAAPLGVAVIALHVHHGLSPHADAWLRHCEATCRRWARQGARVSFAAHRVEGAPRAGDSVEAWARSARYAALRRLALERGVDLVLLAHHRRDQAETFLLQALRGGGVAGLAAMPRVTRSDGVTWMRPWLATPREAIEAYARSHRLRWVEDDSNDDARFARNRLRLRVWPALVEAFTDAEAKLAAAADRAADAAALLADVGAIDAADVAGGDGLDLARWRALSPPRRRQALVEWLRGEIAAAPPASLVARLLDETADDDHRRWPVVGGELRSYRGRVRHDATLATSADLAPSPIDLSRPGVHEVAPWRGAFRVDSVERGGIAAAQAARLVVRARASGDRFQAGARLPARSLKLQYQASGIAPH
ncbi:MAG TPA: tRNA lysidine(34) synthetase TilS, partial [Caldimonas sp.]|nr:tRNA lysidine(34) synthetase TilS [Caldimonas sp.]